jgi:hypothetical protein
MWQPEWLDVGRLFGCRPRVGWPIPTETVVKLSTLGGERHSDRGCSVATKRKPAFRRQASLRVVLGCPERGERTPVLGDCGIVVTCTAAQVVEHVGLLDCPRETTRNPGRGDDPS